MTDKLTLEEAARAALTWMEGYEADCNAYSQAFSFEELDTLRAALATERERRVRSHHTISQIVTALSKLEL